MNARKSCPKPACASAAPCPRCATARFCAWKWSALTWAWSKTRPSTSTSCVTTRTSFRPCHRCIAPPSPAKPPTCRTSKHASGSTGWPIHLTGVTLDSWTRCRCRYVALPAPPFAAAFAMKDTQDTQGVRATYGYDHVARQTFWGLRLHLHVAWPGLITRLTLAPAHAADVAVAPQMLHGQEGGVHWRPQLPLAPTATAALRQEGLLSNY